MLLLALDTQKIVSLIEMGEQSTAELPQPLDPIIPATQLAQERLAQIKFMQTQPLSRQFY